MGIGDLQHLVAQRKGDRSYERLARDCGGTPGAKRLQQLATQPIKNFIDPQTIEGLSRGLGVTRTEVVLACARSLGVPVEHDEALSIDTAGLTPKQTEALRMVVAAMLEGEGDTRVQAAPMTPAITGPIETVEAGPATGNKARRVHTHKVTAADT